ncbi:OOP family OmpA-OmpF porin [Kribbella amoyensis]|uniref:OOP family OmpA-OmpF porin n=1 Tax=Kribbella amoyensis TaxID=996641 RepID=A0A561B8N6_9ACTN|nr:OmpA family protein [Kribbella amoyensis]TWD75326.1 OOP family OmpA-OmpF porin [Kribbella amoyensis]
MPGSADDSRSDTTPATASSKLARRPGVVWLLALLIVPLVLTTLLVAWKGEGLRAASADDRDTGSTEAQATSTPVPSTPAQSSPAQTTASDERTIAPFAVRRTGSTFTVQAVVRDQAAKETVLADVNSLLPEGTEFVDQVSVDEATGLPSTMALSALVRALSAAKGDASVSYDGSTVTLSGQVADQATKATAARAAAKAAPGAVIANQLRVPGTGKPPVSEACRTFETRLARLMSRNKIVFLSGTALVNEASRPSLPRAAALIRSCPTARIEIAGHTDNLGDPATSKPLSQRRADTAKATLVRLGIPADRLISRGYGELLPLASNRTAAGRIANRRVEIRVP